MRLASLLLLTAVVATGCADEPRRTAAQGTPTAAVTAAPTEPVVAESAPVTTTPGASPSASSTASPTESRPAAPAARGVDGDVDGDRRADRVTVLPAEVRVVLSGTGGTVRYAIDSEEEPSLAGVVDVDLDGRAEVFAAVDRGASTTFLLPLRYHAQRLAPLRVDAQAPFLLGVGGTATHGDGFSCTSGGRLVVRSAESDDGASYRVRTTTYRVSGHRLVEISSETATAASPDDPRVRAAYEVDCGSVGDGG